MRKYAFLLFFTLTWAVLCPFMAFKLLCGSFVVEKTVQNPQTAVFASKDGNTDTDNNTCDAGTDNDTTTSNSSQADNFNVENSSNKIHNQNNPSNEQNTSSGSHNLLSIPNADEDIFSMREFEEISLTKKELKVIIKELCPTVVFDEEKVISSVKRDDENRCLYITVGNSALSAESLAKRLSIPTLFFNVEETEDTIDFYPFVN